MNQSKIKGVNTCAITNATTQKKNSNIKNLQISSEDFSMGSHYGHQSFPLTSRSSWNPSLSKDHLGFCENVAFINPLQTQKSLLRAFYIVAGVLKNKGHILLINTSPNYTKLCHYVSGPSISLSNLEMGTYSTTQTKKEQKSNNRETKELLFLNKSSVSSCFYKWVSGTLTNYKQVSKSIHSYMRFTQLFGHDHKVVDFPRYQKVNKSFQGYVKYEPKMSHNLPNNSSNEIQYIQSLPEKPDLLFLMNPSENQNVIFEANKLHIPVIALVQTNTENMEIQGIDYPILCHPSVEFTYYILKKITQLCHIYS
jgi:ribosomal protein S2